MMKPFDDRLRFGRASVARVRCALEAEIGGARHRCRLKIDEHVSRLATPGRDSHECQSYPIDKRPSC